MVMQRAMPQKRSPTSKRFERSLNAKIRALDDDSRQVELSFSSEAAYNRGWCNEIMDHSPDAPDLTRLNEIGVLLFNHNRDKVIGKIIKAWLDEAECRCYAIVEFDTDEASDVIYQKVKNETLKGVSVGYVWDAWEEVAVGKKSANGKHEGPCYVVTKWTALEISIVSIPADSTVGVGREMESDIPEFITECRKRSTTPMSLIDAQIQINQNNCL